MELNGSTLSMSTAAATPFSPRASVESLPSQRYSTVPVQPQVQTFNVAVSDHAFDYTLSNTQKAFYYFLRGHLYNALPFYSALAEDNLAWAVKRDPTLIEAWNSLGECYWKKNDLVAARDCFECALSYVRSCYLSLDQTDHHSISNATRNHSGSWPFCIDNWAKVRFTDFFQCC
jgi:lipoprotein NlpI